MALNRGVKYKPRKKVTSFYFKDLYAAVAVACEVSPATARKIVHTMFDYLIKRIKTRDRIVIKQFGRFKIVRKHYKPELMRALGRSEWRVSFRAAYDMRRRLEGKDFNQVVYGYYVCRKIKRLRLAGDFVEANRCKKLLEKYLVGMPRTVKFLKEKGYWVDDIKYEE